MLTGPISLVPTSCVTLGCDEVDSSVVTEGTEVEVRSFGSTDWPILCPVISSTVVSERSWVLPLVTEVEVRSSGPTDWPLYPVVSSAVVSEGCWVFPPVTGSWLASGHIVTHSVLELSPPEVTLPSSVVMAPGVELSAPLLVVVTSNIGWVSLVIVLSNVLCFHTVVVQLTTPLSVLSKAHVVTGAVLVVRSVADSSEVDLPVDRSHSVLPGPWVIPFVVAVLPLFVIIVSLSLGSSCRLTPL